MVKRKLFPVGDENVLKDEIYDILSNQRRRIALRYLFERSEPCSVAELVDVVADLEAADTGVERTDKLEASVYSALVQSHLPRMADYGFVDYDTETRMVSLTDDARAIEPYLERPHRVAVRWSAVYLAIALLGAITVALTWLDVGPFELLDPLGVAGFIVLLVFVIAAVHTFVLWRYQQGSDIE